MQGTSLELLIREAQAGSKEASEQLVVENSGLIWSVARRYFGRGVGTVKVSRTLKEQSTAIKAARERLTGTLRREPSLAELTAETGLTPEEIAMAETATASTESIQRETGEDGFTLEDVLSGEGEEEQLIERIALREAIAKLPEREQMVVNLRYFHGLTQQKVAGILGVSQVQVSRLEKRALGWLREYL